MIKFLQTALHFTNILLVALYRNFNAAYKFFCVWISLFRLSIQGKLCLECSYRLQSKSRFIEDTFCRILEDRSTFIFLVLIRQLNRYRSLLVIRRAILIFSTTF